MFAPRLINILKTFSPDEIKNFNKFLLSPFFNTSKIYTKFYNELKKFYPNFKNEKLTSEYVYERLFNGKPFNKQTMWNLSSGLEKLAEEFLVHSALSKYPHEKSTIILDEFLMRMLGKHYYKKLKEWEKAAAGYKIDAEELFNLANLESYKVSFWQHIKGRFGKQAESIFEESQIYIILFLVNIASKIDSLNTARTFRGFSISSSLAEDFVRNIDFKRIIEISKKNKYRYAGLIEFYYNVIFCTLERENEKYYINSRNFFFKNQKLFSYQKKKDLTAGLTNYCLEKILSGDANFEVELFKLNKFRLKYNIAATVNGKIGKPLYNQIINNAATLKEFKWADSFIEKYTPLLHEEYQDSMRKLAEAYVYFNAKKFNDVLDSLNKFRSGDANDKLPVKNLIAKTYYELNEFEMLMYHIDTSKHFLNKSKNISDFRKKVNGKFYNYLNSLVTVIEDNKLEKLNTLEDNIRNDNSVNNKVWLLEKIAEITKQKM